MTDDTRLALAYLSRVAEPPCPQLTELVSRVGPVEAARCVKAGAVSQGLARSTEARRGIDCAAEDLDLLSRRGGRLITADDDEWPYLAFSSFAGVDHRERPQAHPPLSLGGRQSSASPRRRPGPVCLENDHFGGRLRDENLAMCSETGCQGESSNRRSSADNSGSGSLQCRRAGSTTGGNR